MKTRKEEGCGDVCYVQDEFSGQNQTKEEIKPENCWSSSPYYFIKNSELSYAKQGP